VRNQIQIFLPVGDCAQSNSNLSSRGRMASILLFQSTTLFVFRTISFSQNFEIFFSRTHPSRCPASVSESLALKILTRISGQRATKKDALCFLSRVDSRSDSPLAGKRDCLHKFTAYIPLCCIASSFLQANRNQTMIFVPRWVPYGVCRAAAACLHPTDRWHPEANSQSTHFIPLRTAATLAQ